MDLLSIRAFLAIAETLSFRGAAERLHMSQPALSLRLRRLEDEIGLRLFDRTRASVVLSSAGREFKPHAERLAGEASAVRAAARRIATGEAGVLRIGYTPISMFGAVPELVRRFAHDHPDVTLDLTELLSDGVEDALVADRIDIGFLHPPTSRRGLDLIDLYEERFVIAVSRHDPLAERECLALRDVSDRDFVLTARTVGPALFGRIIALCRQAGFEPRIKQEVPTSVAAIGLVAAGHGVGLVIGSFARIVWPGVAFIPVAGPSPTLPVVAATRGPQRSPTTTAFLRSVVRSLDHVQ